MTFSLNKILYEWNFKIIYIIIKTIYIFLIVYEILKEIEILYDLYLEIN